MPNYDEQTISVRGRKTRISRRGTGAPLLFLHDSFCPVWLPIHDMLAAQFEVILPIHPGFAGSEESFDEFEEMEDLIFHYLDLCATLGIDRPVLVGASFGGWIAAEWAMRYGATLKSLVLIDALGLRVDGAPAADVLSLDGPALRHALFGDANSALASETIPDTPKAEEMVSTILARRALARLAWQFPDNPRLRRYLHRVELPTMIVWGGRDGFVSPAHGQAFHEGIAGSQFETLANAGHLPHVEAADACADVMKTFLDSAGDK
jgi:pimeloyl-ACP methyl ester carboxylesterase